jgi:chromosome segregation ATPase
MMISPKIASSSAILASLLLLGSAGSIAHAQSNSTTTGSSTASSTTVGSQTVSLGDAARKVRAEKKPAPKSAKVFTNDDLSDLKGTISVIGNDSPSADAKDKPATGEKTSADAKKPAAKDEAYWRAKFAAARRKLADDSKELDILQREFNLKLTQYSQDPTYAMHEQYNREDINKTQSQIDAKKQDVENDKQAISDLEDELRKFGGEPGWAQAPSSSDNSY